jgi:hypothetical protein
MYSWSKDWPTLTEAFFGKGNGPTGKLVEEMKEMIEKKPVSGTGKSKSKK